LQISPLDEQDVTPTDEQQDMSGRRGRSGPDTALIVRPHAEAEALR
jgi:hypothetical protein